MTDNLPDYAALDPPAEKAPVDYSAHERRAEILQEIIEAGTPAKINQSRLADRFDVHDSTISRDMDRLRESIDASLGTNAKLTTRVVFEKTVRELQAEGEWKDAWDVVMDWNEWLADRGDLEREPQRSELDIDMRSHHSEVAYEVVREGDDVSLPTDDDGEPDYEELGFTSAPESIDVEAPRGGDDA